MTNGPEVNFNYHCFLYRPTNRFIDLGDFFVSQKGELINTRHILGTFIRRELCLDGSAYHLGGGWMKRFVDVLKFP